MFKWLRKPKLNVVLTEYLQHKKLQPSTLRLTKRSWELMIEAIGNKRVKKITEVDVKNTHKYWLSVISPTSAKIYHKTVSPVFSWCVRRGYCRYNPFMAVPKPRVAKRLPRIYTDEEFIRLVKATADLLPENRFRWLLILLLAKTTGMRKSAIQNLCRQDIDFEQMTIIVQAKSGTGYWPWQPKDKESRVVPLVPQIANMLVELVYQLPQSQPYVLIKPARYYHLLEAHRVGLMSDAMRMSPISNFDRTFQKLKKKASVSARFHDLRATCLTDLSEVLTLQEVAEIAGHSDIKTTMVYLGVKNRRDTVDRARSKVSACLRDVAAPSHALLPN